jgi:hypothetical protein
VSLRAHGAVLAVRGGLPNRCGQKPLISEAIVAGRKWPWLPLDRDTARAGLSAAAGIWPGRTTEKPPARPPKRSGPAWCSWKGQRPPVRASAGTNFAASTVPQPLARSYPGAAS